MCVCLCVWVCELNIDRGWHSWCFEEVYVGCLKATCLCLCVCVFVCVCVCVSVCVLYIERLVWLMRLSRLFWAAVCVCVCVCGFWVHEKFRIVHAFRFLYVWQVSVCVCVCVYESEYVFLCARERKKRVCPYVCSIHIHIRVYICVFNTYIYIYNPRVRHDLFTRDTNQSWLIHVQLIRDSFTCTCICTYIYICIYLIRDVFTSHSWLIQLIRDSWRVTHSRVLIHDSFTCGTSHSSCVTFIVCHIHVWHSFTCVTILIPMCDVTHLHLRHCTCPTYVQT